MEFGKDVTIELEFIKRTVVYNSPGPYNDFDHI